jgi:hypothetical protein
MVPYKQPTSLQSDEYALNLLDSSLNETAFNIFSKRIRQAFANDNKPVDDSGVQKKIENTIKFLESFKDKQ